MDGHTRIETNLSPFVVSLTSVTIQISTPEFSCKMRFPGLISWSHIVGIAIVSTFISFNFRLWTYKKK
nr:MAG TPA: hypothetical protein [Crassvirales sp.]